MRFWINLVMFFSLKIMGLSHGETTMKNENATISHSALKQQLLDGYDKTQSAILFGNSSYSYREIILLNVQHILDLDEKRGILVSNYFIGLGWFDARLEWKAKTNGIRYLKFLCEDVWTPDLILLNQAQELQRNEEQPLLSFSGYMWWGRALTLYTKCIPNLKYFPFDVQHCDVEIAALTQNGDIMELTETLPRLVKLKFPRVSKAISNTRWKLEDVTAHSQRKSLKDGHKIDAEVFTLVLRRTTPLIAMGTLTPCIISVLVILKSFWIQPGNAIRTAMIAVGVIISSSTLFTLGKIVPVTGDETPIIVQYAATAVILTILSSVHTVIVTVLIRMTVPFPFSYVLLFSRLPPWVLFFLGVKPISEKETTKDQIFLFSELSEEPTLEIPENVMSSDTNGEDVEATMDDLMKPPRKNLTRSMVSDGEWLLPVTIMDRMSFYVYLIVCGLFTLSIMITE